MTLPLGVLDLSILGDGTTSHDALQATTVLAKVADRHGYHRFWVAEHHNMETVACTSPTVLMAHLAAVTERIRIGSGGVMLPNHSTLAVAEQFALLEALHPGRIDAGIGRAPGTDQRTALALRRSRELLHVDSFPHDVLDLLGLLGEPRTDHGMWHTFRATAEATGAPQVFLLGSSDYSARLAGHLGLPFGFAHHFDMGGTLEAAEIYRASFTPSPTLDRPHLLVTANVLVAATDEEANWHAAPGRITALARRTGQFVRLPSPQDAAAHPLLDEAMRLPTGRMVGTPDTVVPALHALAERTQADELMVTAVAYDLAARVASLELLAGAWR